MQESTQMMGWIINDGQQSSPGTSGESCAITDQPGIIDIYYKALVNKHDGTMLEQWQGPVVRYLQAIGNNSCVWVAQWEVTSNLPSIK